MNVRVASLLAAGVLMSGLASAQPADQAAEQARAAAAAREAFESTLPWTFRGVTYPSQRYFVENFKCGAEKYKFARQGDEEKFFDLGKGKPGGGGGGDAGRHGRRDRRLLPRHQQGHAASPTATSPTRRSQRRSTCSTRPTRRRAGRSTSSRPIARPTPPGTRWARAPRPRRQMKTALRQGTRRRPQHLLEQHGRRPARLGDVPVELRRATRPTTAS